MCIYIYIYICIYIYQVKRGPPSDVLDVADVHSGEPLGFHDTPFCLRWILKVAAVKNNLFAKLCRGSQEGSSLMGFRVEGLGIRV